MKKIILSVLLVVAIVAGVAFFVLRPSAAQYIRLTHVDYIVDLLNESLTMEELESTAGFRLWNRSDRINARNRRINQIRRDDATITTRTTGMIWGHYGFQFVDLTSTMRPPDSELNLLGMVALGHVLEVARIPGGARDYFSDNSLISFYFAPFADVEADRLRVVTMTGLTHFGGVDFTQFDSVDIETVEKDLINVYGWDAEILWNRAMNPMHIEMYHGNVQFVLRPRNGVVTVEAILLDEAPTRPSNRADVYKQFADINFLTHLIHQAPTQEALSVLGLRLINRGERLDSDDARLHNIWEAVNVPRAARDYLDYLLFRFDTYLYQINVTGLIHFNDIDFSQFDEIADIDEIMRILLEEYNLATTITGVGTTPILSFFHEGVEFRMTGIGAPPIIPRTGQPAHRNSGITSLIVTLVD